MEDAGPQVADNAEGSSRKRRHESDADSSGDDNALVDDSASPQLLATLRSEDASAQLEKTDAAAGARLALPQACIGPIPPPPSSSS